MLEMTVKLPLFFESCEIRKSGTTAYLVGNILDSWFFLKKQLAKTQHHGQLPTFLYSKNNEIMLFIH